jgi:ELWxxDGT repeat protein
MPRRAVRLALAAALLAACAAAERPFRITGAANPAPFPLVPYLDINAGYAVVGGNAYFAGTHQATGPALWRTDGSAAGTVLIKGFRPPSGSYGPAGITAVGNRILFFTDDGTHGAELWSSDGTTEGTRLVVDACPGPCSTLPFLQILYQRPPLAVGNRLFYPGGASTEDTLWVSDGTAAGTMRVFDASPIKGQLVEAGGLVYFPVEGGIGRSDGTPSGSSVVVPVEALEGLVPLGSGLVFVHDDGVHGRELWHSDGTPQGTGMVADLCPGPCSPFEYVSSPEIVTVGSFAYFAGSTPATGPALWRTNGTAAGTTLVLDPAPGARGSVAWLTPFRDRLVFQADDGVHGPELWVSDGTQQGTKMIGDFAPGPGGPWLGSRRFVAGNLLFFAAGLPGVGGAYWRTDGTLKGTGMITFIAPDTQTWWQEYLVGPLGSRALLTATDQVRSVLWISDGARAGTSPLFPPDVGLEPSGSLPTALTPVGQDLYYLTDYQPLWRTDGTPGAAVRLLDNMFPSGPRILLDVDGSLVFATFDAVWRSDGTSSGTQRIYPYPFTNSWSSSIDCLAHIGRTVFISDHGLWAMQSDGAPGEARQLLAPAPDDYGFDIPEMTAAATQLYFSIRGSSSLSGLWHSDGTQAGTVRVPGSPEAAYSLVAVGERLFFTLGSYEQGREPWVADLAGGARPLGDLCPGSCSSGPWWQAPWPAVLNDRLYFTADDGTHGEELWVSDGTPEGTRMVADLTPGPDSRPITEMKVAGQTLFFAFDDGVHGNELWATDGTATGTRMVADIAPGLESGAPQALTVSNGTLFFTADDGVHGVELWRSDGTSNGTWLVEDLLPGPASSAPRTLCTAGSRLYFTAYDVSNGRELWALETARTSPIRQRLTRP